MIGSLGLLLIIWIVADAWLEHRNQVQRFRTEPPRLRDGETVVEGVYSASTDTATFTLPSGRHVTIGPPEADWSIHNSVSGPGAELRMSATRAAVLLGVGVAFHGVGCAVRRARGRHRPE